MSEGSEVSTSSKSSGDSGWLKRLTDRTLLKIGKLADKEDYANSLAGLYKSETKVGTSALELSKVFPSNCKYQFNSYIFFSTFPGLGSVLPSLPEWNGKQKDGLSAIPANWKIEPISTRPFV